MLPRIHYAAVFNTVTIMQKITANFTFLVQYPWLHDCTLLRVTRVAMIKLSRFISTAVLYHL